MTPRKQRVDIANATIMKRNEYVRALDSIIAGGFCPFCEKNLFKHHHEPLIYKTKYWLVTKNSWPYEGARFHFLFITRVHIEATEKMSPEMWANLHTLYKKLVAKNSIKGATLFIRSGNTKFTSASVNHLHAQLVVGTPRTKTTRPIAVPIGFKK